jgi:bifunctional non-homologous end joining protein LigD
MPARTTKRPARAPRDRLARYLAKRDLRHSGEPGDTARRATAGAVRRFVIQKHDATRLHYDFRLEMDGVYRSWAVPKGLPVKPGDRALAVEVEDHPLEYGKFEGVIPEGNYGAGTVMLWDRGHYTVASGAPEDAYRRGKIHLALAGEKSVGEWTLVRMRPRPGDRATNWLVIKNSAPEHRAALAGAARDRSVLSGRTLDEIATGGGRRTRSRPPATTRTRTAKKKAAPRTAKTRLAPATFIPPMKALSVDALPEGDWRLEIKLDGYRALAVINGGEVSLWSRNRKELTADYPEIVEALKKIPCANAAIDGEIVALDAQGRSRFQLLQGRAMNGERPPIVYYAFDLLHHDGRPMIESPIEERQMALQVLLGKKSGAVRFSPVFRMEAGKLLDEVRRQGLEGIVAKAAGSRYEPDRRSGAWVKVKVHGEQEFVIGGFTAPRNSRTHFGAILVGYHDGKKLLYAGKVGTGFDGALLASLHREFMQRKTSRCPFANLPQPRKPRFGLGMTARAMKDVTWIKPELVAQVRFAEWTDDGLLRQPVFLGLRRDKPAREVVREAPPATEPAG